MTTLRVPEREATLLDLLDRLLDRGVVAAGELTLSVAEVDLIFVSLRLAVTSVDKIWESRARPSQGGEASGPPLGGGGAPAPAPHTRGNHLQTGMCQEQARGGLQGRRPPLAGECREAPQYISPPPLPRAREGDKGGEGLESDKAANGLARLVLTIVELLRNLLEREALRRMERDTLAPWEVERLGQAFLSMEQKMREMREFFHLKEEDLNLDLGPLGKLR